VSILIQDKSDDIEIGVKSTAILFGYQTKYWLSAFSIGMVANLALAGLASHQTWPYFAGVGLTAAHLAWQVSYEDCNPRPKLYNKKT
jgi:4-hydroxybenzoate polyprenyltransferase